MSTPREVVGAGYTGRKEVDAMPYPVNISPRSCNVGELTHL